MTYLSYDIRGIQSFIFRVPRLASIIGGSALVDVFDGKAEKMPGSLFAGGGRGVFECADAAGAEALQMKLVKSAQDCGMDIRFGQDDDYVKAVTCADRLFSYLPDVHELTAIPCKQTGLWPVKEEGAIHRLSKMRDQRGEGGNSRHFEERFIDKGLDLGPEFRDRRWEFFHNVDERETRLALGDRGRFAVICMDGNDVGNQFRVAAEKLHGQALQNWTARAAKALRETTLHAVGQGIMGVVRHWAYDDVNATKPSLANPVTLPIRPLLVGGDDVAVLCRTDLAMQFVTVVCEQFTHHAKVEAEKAAKDGIAPLWPATEDHLTISAGVLFCSDRMPLHSAIGYAEMLLGSAKGKGRKEASANQPAPPCVDFEVVTEGLLDSPADRRHRQLVFKDGDAGGCVTRLTRRPYTVHEINALQQHPLVQLPPSIRHDLMRGLRCGLHDRRLHLARLGKRADAKLLKGLEQNDKGEPMGDNSYWTLNGKAVETDALDAMLLAEEANKLNGSKSAKGGEA